jgi:hypothetical protein
MKVYVLQHVHPLAGGTEDVKLIGVYSSLGNARAAIARLTRQPGFSETPDGFHVDGYQVDKDHWLEGYTETAMLPRPHQKTTGTRKPTPTRR